MRNAGWWIAMTLTAANAVTFVFAMPVFFRARRGSMALRLVLFASIAAALALIIYRIGAHPRVDVLPAVLGSGLALGAQALFWSALKAHQGYHPWGAFASDVPPAIVSEGPYRLIRHPFHVAYVLAFAAGVVFSEEPVLWAVPAWMMTLYALAAAQEERLLLASPLGTRYGAYRRRTGAFVPRLRTDEVRGGCRVGPDLHRKGPCARAFEAIHLVSALLAPGTLPALSF